MKTALLLFIPLLLCTSCSKERPPNPRWDPPIVLPYIWKSPLKNPSEGYYTMSPILSGNHIISSIYKFDPNTNEELIAFNKNNGELAWNWSEFPSPAWQYIQDESTTKVWGNTLAAISESDIFALDTESGQTLWASSEENRGESLSQHENLIFHVKSYGLSDEYADSAQIRMTDINSENWKTVYTHHKNEGSYIHVLPPSLYIEDNSDTLLLFLNLSHTGIPSQVQADLYCYNMSQDSIQWVQEDFLLEGGYHRRYSPTIDGDYIIVSGAQSTHCLNIINGDIIWSELYSRMKMDGNLLVYENVIFTTVDSQGLIAINKYTGKKVWNVRYSLDNRPVDLRIYNDRVYLSSRYLHIFDANGGLLRYKIASPHENTSFKNPVVIDVSTNKMYINDDSYMLCMEVPE